MDLITSEAEGLRPLDGDLTSQVLVIKHTLLGGRYQQPRFQLFKARGGFGCNPSSLGRAVFGTHIASGDDGRYQRNAFVGIASRSLIDAALADARPVPDIDINEREYMLVAKDGCRGRGKTVEIARQRLERQTNSPVMMSLRLHPESIVLEYGFISYPDGAAPEEIRIKKGKEWTAVT
jgi:hypothetical protein